MEENVRHSGGRGESKHVRPLVSAATGQIRGYMNEIMIVYNHDPGLEVNIMTCKIQEKCGLPIDNSPRARWKMRLAAEELSAQMLGICWDCVINIGGIVIKCHIFVCEAADYDCLLGTPFEVAARLETKVTNDGARWYRIFSQDGHKSVQYCGARGDEPRNCLTLLIPSRS